MVPLVIVLNQVVLPAGGSPLTTSEEYQQLVGFALKASKNTASRIQRRRQLADMDAEDIEQELLAYVLEHADQYAPQRGSIEAYVTQLLRTAVAKLIRESRRQRNKPPKGVSLQSLSTYVDGPNRRSEELMKGLALSDKDRRRQTESRDPLKNVELSDAVERQIRALPRGCRQVAQLLKFYSPDEVAIRLGWSKRKVKKIIALISQHFAAVEWDEIDLRRIKKFPNCIVNTGEEEISKPNHPSHEKDEL